MLQLSAGLPWPRGSSAFSLTAAGWVGCATGGCGQSFWGQTGVVNVLEGGEGCPDDLLSCSCFVLERLPAGCNASSISHVEAAGQDALDGAPGEGAHGGSGGSPRNLVLLTLSTAAPSTVRGACWVGFSEVHNNLLYLVHVKCEIVSTPHSQAAHHTPVLILRPCGSI